MDTPWTDEQRQRRRRNQPVTGPQKWKEKENAIKNARDNSRTDPPRVVIVGGGPVGLLTAIHLKTKHPASHVVLCQDREYTREQILALEPSTIRALPLAVRADLFDTRSDQAGGPSAGAYVIQPGYDMLGVAYGKPGAPPEAKDDGEQSERSVRRYGSITTRELEKALITELVSAHGAEVVDHYQRWSGWPSSNTQGSLLIFRGCRVNAAALSASSMDIPLTRRDNGASFGTIPADDYDYLLACGGTRDSVVSSLLGGRENAQQWTNAIQPPRMWKSGRDQGKWEYHTDAECELFGAIVTWVPSPEQQAGQHLIRERSAPGATDQIVEQDSANYSTRGPNAAWRSFRSRSEKFYLGVTLTKEEYGALKSDFGSASSWSGRAGIEQLLQSHAGKQFVGLINDGMKTFAMSGPTGDASSFTAAILESKISRAKEPAQVIGGKMVVAVGDAACTCRWFVFCCGG